MERTVDAPARDRIRAVAAQLGVTLAAAQAEQMLRYLSLLERWSAVHNLSALQNREEILIRLVFDSLSLSAALFRHAGGRELSVLDVGTGSGFPAAAIAIAQPGWAVSAVDSVAKKVAFVQQAAADCDIANLRAIEARVENLPPGDGFDAIVSKAFGSLANLVVRTERLQKAGGVWVAQKGKHPASEIAELPPRFQVFHVEPVTVPHLIEERCLVWLRRSEAR